MHEAIFLGLRQKYVNVNPRLMWLYFENLTPLAIEHELNQRENPDWTQFLHHGWESDVVTRLLRETNKSATCMINWHKESFRAVWREENKTIICCCCRPRLPIKIDLYSISQLMNQPAVISETRNARSPCALHTDRFTSRDLDRRRRTIRGWRLS
jgi:hypothetical protein